MKYIISGFKFYKEFNSENEARNCFEAVKTNFTYCELKVANISSTNYYAKSIEIFRK